MVLGPNLVRRQLGRRLMKLREASGTTEREVLSVTGMSKSKLWRIESGLVRIKKPDVWALCRVYGVDGAVTDALAALCEGTASRGWWEEYADVVPEWFRLYVDLESAAEQICCYEGEVVPGELQTADYTRAFYRAMCPDETDDAIARRVALRLERQHTLSRRSPPTRLHAVLGENVLRRAMGGAGVLRKQIVHLRELARLDHVDIRILTWRSGAHPALLGAFRILDFPDGEPALVYLQMLSGAHYMEETGDVEVYRRVWKQINEQAVPLEQHLS